MLKHLKICLNNNCLTSLCIYYIPSKQRGKEAPNFLEYSACFMRFTEHTSLNPFSNPIFLMYHQMLGYRVRKRGAVVLSWHICVCKINTVLKVSFLFILCSHVISNYLTYFPTTMWTNWMYKIWHRQQLCTRVIYGDINHPINHCKKWTQKQIWATNHW